MKYARNVDVPVVLHEVRDAVVPVQENSDIPRRRKVTVTDLQELRKNLRPFENSLNRPGGSGIIRRDVFDNVREPALRLRGPRYFFASFRSRSSERFFSMSSSLDLGTSSTCSESIFSRCTCSALESPEIATVM